jgi:hypothetical protein
MRLKFICWMSKPSSRSRAPLSLASSREIDDRPSNIGDEISDGRATDPHPTLVSSEEAALLAVSDLWLPVI